MRRYRSQRIQKTLIALSGAALASTMMFSNAQSIQTPSASYEYYKTKIDSQLHKAEKANKEEKHKSKKQKVVKENKL